LSFTIAIISNEEGQDKKHTLLELIVSFASWLSNQHSESWY
jgi:hypothetical protein